MCTDLSPTNPSLSLSIYMFTYSKNIPYPICKYSHAGFPTTPSHAGAARRGAGDRGSAWGVGWGVAPYGYISLLHIGYWTFVSLSLYIYIYMNKSTNTYIHVYIYINRERDSYTYIYIYVCVYICICIYQ